MTVAGATAQRRGESTGADKSCTLEAFVHRVETGQIRLGPKGVIALDEVEAGVAAVGPTAPTDGVPGRDLARPGPVPWRCSPLPPAASPRSEGCAGLSAAMRF